MRCPYQEHGICAIATRIANRAVKLNEAACDRCLQDVVPMAINPITTSIAINAMRQAGDPVSVDLMRQATGRYDLAGYRVERYIHRWLKRLRIQPPASCGCEEWVAKMNAWGVQGSIEHIDEIVDHLYANLQTTYLAGVAVAFIAKPIIKQRVMSCLLKERS